MSSESHDLSDFAASAMLEDALHQFDNIIGTGQTDGTAEFFGNGLQGIAQLLDDLRVTIQAEDMNSQEKQKLLSLLSPETLCFFRDLFHSDSKKYEAKIFKESEKLKNENETLSLQVSVLSDQVELQMERMSELEESNKEMKNQLSKTEQSLQNTIQTADEFKQEVDILTKRIKEQNQVLVNIESRGSHSPVKGQIVHHDVTTPDEGIVRDEIDAVLKSKLRLVPPTATSTPISSLDPRNVFILESGGTLQQVNPVENSLSIKTPLTGIEKSSSHSEHLDQIDVATLVKQPDFMQTTKSSSSPNLAVGECQPSQNSFQRKGILVNKRPRLDEETIPFQSRRKHGIKKFFSSFRLRRSHSSNISDNDMTSQFGAKTIINSGVKISADHSPFKRGGFRATAGPRLGESKPKIFEAKNKPFAQWTTQDICDWFESLGFDTYLENCRRWVKNGATLLQATNQDIEKELGICNPLHKKKLLLSLQGVGDEDDEGQIIQGDGMDYTAVARWLDDIGLPQYKEVFYKARIDCRMLHHLTIADLQRLKITNLLHTLSLRQAIHTLRKLNFDHMQLKRRPVNQAVEAEETQLWTNHRVMEWLRSIDLAEFAPNLRGSGVHGSLMVFEPQFTGEVLASLLHIPSSKSLLRRHLVSKFKELIPSEFMTLKQKEAALGGLNVMAKVKVGRKSFGPLARFRHLGSNSYREFSSGEYVCPVQTKNSSQLSLGAQRRKLQVQELKKSTRFDTDDVILDSASDDSSNVNVVELDESATKKIGVFSAEIATLTNKWSED